MGRMRHYIICYNSNSKLFYIYNKVELKVNTAAGIDDVMSFLQKYKDDVSVQWRGFKDTFSSVVSYLLNNNYVYTSKHNNTKLHELEMNYLVTDKTVYTLKFKRDCKKIINIVNLDNLLFVNDGDLKDFNNINNVIDGVPDKVKYVIDAVNYLDSCDVTGITIGGACKTQALGYIKKNRELLDKYKIGDGKYAKQLIDILFPNLEYKIDGQYQKVLSKDGTKKIPVTVWYYVHDAYRGGLCICEHENEIVDENITVMDINSSYCYVLHSKSGNRYPVGQPAFSYKRLKDDRDLWYIVDVDVRLDLKKDGINFLEISDFHSTHKLKLTCTDLDLLYDNYNVYYMKEQSFLYFKTEIGLFDDYIDFWYNIKQTAERGSALYRIAKLMLNNLHGRFGIKPYGDVYIYEDASLNKSKVKNKIPTFYIPIGAACFSYARKKLIEAIKYNKIRFNYSDTDSMHIKGSVEDIKYIKIDDSELGAWKVEHICDRVLYLGKKRYIMHELKKDGRYDYKIVWSGVDRRTAGILRAALHCGDGSEKMKQAVINAKGYTEEEKSYILKGITFEDILSGSRPPNFIEYFDEE